MVLLLARCWYYKLKTEDVLELTRGNRRIALCTVVGLLEDGETYSTELKQRQRPGEGQIGQWEHELVCERYEKPLLLQICRLLRGFTHPGTYFEAGVGEELALYSVEKFADEMSTLLNITLKSRLVEKLSSALFDCLFGDNRVRSSNSKRAATEVNEDDLLDESDHIAVVSVNAFIQNLYFYAAEHNEMFRLHILEETLFIPRFILPYLDRCIQHVTILSGKLDQQPNLASNSKEDDDDEHFGWWTHFPQLISGISSSLRSLIIATFRASHTHVLSSSLLRLNPTSALLHAEAFCLNHEYIFSLLCMLNVNAGAVDISSAGSRQRARDSASPLELLDDLARIYGKMSASARTRVCRRVSGSGAVPVSRDTPSYVAMMSVLSGGEAGQLRYAVGGLARDEADGDCDLQPLSESRAEVKAEVARRLSSGLAVQTQHLETAAAEVVTVRRLSLTGIGENKAVEEESTARMLSDEKLIAPVSAASKSSNRPTGSSGLSSLGDLPSLSVPKAKAFAMDAAPSKGKSKGGRGGRQDQGLLPPEFLCAINGHVMKEPVRCVATSLVFERSTIELWLSTRGAVCPITNTLLEKKDLVPDDELRNRIMRYHIQQTSLRVAETHDDDLYDF
jgi:hypothetical protein